MLVKYWMNEKPVTVTPETSMRRAQELLEQGGLTHLPVLDYDGKLVGIVSRIDVLRASPPSVTSWSAAETDYLVDQIQVSHIMVRDPVTVGPEDTVEDAAILGSQKGYGAFPVVDKGKLVGLITREVLVNIIMSIFKGTGEDARITIENIPEEVRGVGTVSAIIEIVGRHEARVNSILSFSPKLDDMFTYLVRVTRGSEKEIAEDLKASGYPVTHLT